MTPDNGWQPIETAPRDGTRIVVAGQHDGEWYFLEDYWRDYLFGGEGFGLWGVHRSHWMHLPPTKETP